MKESEGKVDSFAGYAVRQIVGVSSMRNSCAVRALKKPGLGRQNWEQTWHWRKLGRVSFTGRRRGNPNTQRAEKNITKGKESCSKYLQQVTTAIPPSFSVRLISLAPATGSGKKKIPKFVTLASNVELPNFRSWPLITAALTLLAQPLERIWACMMSIMSGEASTQRIWAEG